MQKFEVIKTFEAAKLNKRTGSPLTEHPTTIPYGAILDTVEESGRFLKFSYLGERYQILLGNSSGTMQALHRAESAPRPAETPAPAPASIKEAPVREAAPEVPDARPVLTFESLRTSGGPALTRAKIPGGWLVAGSGGVAFVPDEYHAWDGGSHT